MSNKTRLQTNNTNLQALIDKANTLPDAGSVETCTVTINFIDGAAGYPEGAGNVTLRYPKVVSETVEYTKVMINSDSTSINDMYKGSMFMLCIPDDPGIFGGSGLVYQNLELVYHNALKPNHSTIFTFFISDSSGTITIN